MVPMASLTRWAVGTVLWASLASALGPLYMVSGDSKTEGETYSPFFSTSNRQEGV